MEQIAGRYTLVREVGRGGMGAVWLARDEVLLRNVALKQLASADVAEHEARAEREARVSAMLNHPNIVTVFDLAQDNGQSWLVMEYLDSLTLSARIREQGALAPDDAALLLTQAADALAVAHRAGIVHRDVKPGNMLVTPSGLLKLGDFGIARSGADASLTRTGLVTGSPGYLAPEVAAGGTATPASDVWSLGASIFHAVAGHPPYDTSENLMGTLYRLVNDEPPRTERAGWLDPVLRATMERDPQRRWSARQVQAFLERAETVGGFTLHDATATDAAVPLTSTSDATPLVDVPHERTQIFASAEEAAPRRKWWPLLVVAVTLIALTTGGWLLGRDDPQPGGKSASSQSPTPDPTVTPEPTETGMTEFVRDYLERAPSAPEQAYRMLTPEYRAESGFLAGYRSWWDKVKSARATQIKPDPASLTVSYRVRNDMRSGRDIVEDIVLTLSFADGTYLIDGAS